MPISKVRVLFQRNNVVIYISCTPLQLYYFLITKWSKTKTNILKKLLLAEFLYGKESGDSHPA